VDMRRENSRIPYGGTYSPKFNKVQVLISTRTISETLIADADKRVLEMKFFFHLQIFVTDVWSLETRFYASPIIAIGDTGLLRCDSDDLHLRHVSLYSRLL